MELRSHTVYFRRENNAGRRGIAPKSPIHNGVLFHDLRNDSLLSGEQVVDSSELRIEDGFVIHPCSLLVLIITRGTLCYQQNLRLAENTTLRERHPQKYRER